MSDGVASGVGNDSIEPNGTTRVLGPRPMAGIVMSAHHGEENVDQLSSQTAGSPYHYTHHKDSDTTTGRMSVQGSVCTDVDTDPGTDAVASSTTKPGLRAQRTGDSAAAGKTNGASGHTQPTGVRKRGDSRAASHHIYRYRSHAPTKANKPLVDPRLYRRAYSTESTHSHYEKAMRRSAHRLVSATTRFDRMTTGALSFLADIARMYLMRIGEACKARADLANRAEPNLSDVLESGTGDLGIDWGALCEWADEWKAEAGDVVPSSTPAEGGEEVQHKATRSAADSSFGVLAGSSADAYAAGGDDIDDLIDSLDLGCLLLGDMGVADDTETIIPPHLPPLVPMADEETPEDSSILPHPGPLVENGTIAKAQEAPISASNGDGDYADRPMSPDSDSEETPENIAAHMLHLASSSLSTLPASVTGNKALYSFFRPAAKADPSCAPDDVLPSFDIPDPALVAAPEYIKERLSSKEKLPPGVPMFLAAESEQRDVLGDIECQWREARHDLYDDIYEEAAERAIEEMNNAPIPMRRRRHSDASEEEAELSHAVDGVRDEPLERNGETDLDINIDEDVMVMDLDMDLDLDLDIMTGLSDSRDLMNGPSDSRADGGDAGDNMHGQHLIGRDAGDHIQGQHANGTAADVQTVVEEEPEPVDLPVSNGLRGSGVPHWSNEWFTPAMEQRLSRITAQDILPCDSLFMSSPAAGQRHVVDEIARAFVDSEGGGHLHETTPLEGFGPPANTFKVPSASGSALRWVLHHITQTRGVSTVDSLYTGRASLAGGIAGDGIEQYATRVCSLIKGSAEEEAELVVNGALAHDRSQQWADRRLNPGPAQLMEQLVAGADKRIPWAQERMDIHVLEASIVGREPQPAVTKPVLLTSTLPTTPSVAPASSPAQNASPLVRSLPLAQSASPLVQNVPLARDASLTQSEPLAQ
ncbi:hypothetical protein IWW50_002125, partial [Coemansia erecta]